MTIQNHGKLQQHILENEKLTQGPEETINDKDVTNKKPGEEKESALQLLNVLTDLVREERNRVDCLKDIEKLICGIYKYKSLKSYWYS